MADLFNKSGPNRLRSSNNSKVINPEDAVKLRLNKDTDEPISIPSLLERTASDFSNNPALVYKNVTTKQWTTVTYRQYEEKVHHIAKAFIKLGLKARHTVGVLAFNCPEWFYSELAAIHAGGIIAGIYTTNSPDAVYYVLQSSRANLVIVDDAKQMEKIHQIKHKLPLLKAAIQIQEPYEPYVKKEDGYYRWSDLEYMNVDDEEDEYKRRLENVAINECCCLVYTSGTVGNPKGVMISHDNMTWDSRALVKTLGNINYGQEVLVSYLPLSHVAAQILDLFLSLTVGGTVYFADKDALKGSLVKTLTEARPTRFLAVPRVYEKIQEKLISIGSQQKNGLRRALINWAKNVTLQHHIESINGKNSESFQYKLARCMIMSKVKTALGFDRCLTFVSGAAPISADTKKFFLALDIKIIEAFGMSETSGGHCLATGDCPLEAVGKTIVGCETKIVNPDENGHGEICMRGRHVFMGYIFDKEKTDEALDDDGWMHSGDLGYTDEKGYVYITGRLKELLITAGGENIPPVHIEHLVKNELPAISNAILVGDKRKYLTILLTFKTEIDSKTEIPTNALTTEAQNWINSLGVNYKTVDEILEAGPCPKVLKAIQEGIDRANKQSISNAQKIQKFAILPRDFSVATGELGPTLKLKRNVVIKMYENIINDLYKE